MDAKLEKLLINGDFKSLSAYCKEHSVVYPDKNEYLFYYSISLFALGDHGKANNSFQKLFKKTGQYFYLICKSLNEYASGNMKQAEKDLAEAIENDEDIGDILLAFDVARVSNDFEDAKKALKKALEIEPKRTVEKVEDVFEKLKNLKNEDRSLIVSTMHLLRLLEKER